LCTTSGGGVVDAAHAQTAIARARRSPERTAKGWHGAPRAGKSRRQSVPPSSVCEQAELTTSTQLPFMHLKVS
jgi:hypothetical protein